MFAYLAPWEQRPLASVCHRRSRESGSREADGRRNWPEAVPRKSSGRKRELTGIGNQVGIESKGRGRRKRLVVLAEAALDDPAPVASWAEIRFGLDGWTETPSSFHLGTTPAAVLRLGHTLSEPKRRIWPRCRRGTRRIRPATQAMSSGPGFQAGFRRGAHCSARKHTTPATATPNARASSFPRLRLLNLQRKPRPLSVV